jgi:hypothetical protein
LGIIEGVLTIRRPAQPMKLIAAGGRDLVELQISRPDTAALNKTLACNKVERPCAQGRRLTVVAD